MRQTIRRRVLAALVRSGECGPSVTTDWSAADPFTGGA